MARGLHRVADRMFARDLFSLEELKRNGISGNKVKLCPDYSAPVKPKKCEKQKKYKNFVCLIPNFRFVDKSNTDMEKYASVFEETIEYITYKGTECYFVVHSEIDDEKIEEKIKKVLKSMNIPTKKELNEINKKLDKLTEAIENK